MNQSKVSQFSQSKLPSFGLSQISHNYSQMNTSIAPGFTSTPCPSHPQYLITNICRSTSCIEPLCPECIPSHIQLHEKSKQPSRIQTIVNARVQCIQKLAEQKYYLETDLEVINNQYSTNPQLIVSDLKTKLANSKSKLTKMIDKIYDQMNEQIQIIYSAHCSESERNYLQGRKVATPFSEHLDFVTMQKHQLQSDDFISTLIQLLSEFPRRPEYKPIKKAPEFGSVEVNAKMLQEVHKAIQKYTHVIVNCKQQTNSKMINIKSNNSKFSRLSAEKSRTIERSRSKDRSIFQSKVTAPILKDTIAESYYNEPLFKVFYQPTKLNYVQITQPDYFRNGGPLAYFQDNTRNIHLMQISSMESGFHCRDLNINFLIPQQHRSLVTPQKQIFILGGCINELPTNKVYTVNGDTLLQLPSMNSERYNFGICYHEDCIYVAGGLQSRPINKFERYNIKKRCWSVLRPCLQNNYGCELSAFNHYIAKLGGKGNNNNINSLQLYNIQADSWTSISFDYNFTVPASCGFSQISSNELLVFGGFINEVKTNQVSVLRFNGNNLSVYRTVQIYADSSFSNPCYVSGGHLVAFQNTTKGTNKNILKFNGNNWKFVSC